MTELFVSDTLQNMDPVDGNVSQTSSMNTDFGIHNNILLPQTLDVSSYNVSSMKDHCGMLRNCTNAGYLSKNEFIDNIAADMSLNDDFESRYRENRHISTNFSKIYTSSLYELKTLNNDAHDLSFSEDLRTLNRASTPISSFGYYPKNVSSNTNTYNQDFANDFTSNTFTNSLPPTSSLFSHDDTSPCYAMPENQSDEMLLNGIELNEHEKLVLSNEELAMLTQGKPGSCLELILNNGEVIYAVIDSENEFGSTSRLLQIPKETVASTRQCSLPQLDSEITNQLNESHYENNLPDATTFHSKSSTVDHFNANDRNYHDSHFHNSFPKTISSSDSFNFCCDFSSNENTSHFPYTSIVSTKPHTSFDHPSLQKSDLTYTCASEGTSSTKQIPDIESSTKMITRSSEPKIDYFPSAVNSIIVSETGKKYPKKYSFYSNNISSFLNQENSFSKTTSSSIDSVRQADFQDLTHISRGICSNMSSVDGNVEANNLSSVSSMVGQIPSSLKSSNSAIANASLVSNEQKKIICHVDLTNDDEVTNNSCNEFTGENLFTKEDEVKPKYTISRSTVAVNSICDHAVQSRARATLPSAYLSINRIKNESKNSKPVYGVFACKMIPNRTQFGPMEGVLIKNEEEEEDFSSNIHMNNILQLTVLSENGKLRKLDVSNEDLSNWMRFVRAANTYKEQNLILGQLGNSLYFTTIEVIHPHQELLVWYEVVYSRSRNYKLLPGDPCVNVNTPYDMMERMDDLTILNLHKSSKNAVASISPEVSLHDRSSPSNQNGEMSKTGINTINDAGISTIKKSSTESQRTKRTPRKNEKSTSLWLCNSCDLTFSNGATMNLHALTHADRVKTSDIAVKNDEPQNMKSHLCPQCTQSFSDKNELISHVSKHGLMVQRWADNKTAVSCLNKESEDGEIFISQDDKNIGEQRYPCPSCKRVMKTEVALWIHERTHSEDSSLECPLCGDFFKKLSALQKHVYTHAKNGIFSCPHCPKTNNRYSVIRKHIRSCHVAAKYLCSECSKSFRTPHKLRLHMIKHSDTRQFLCANCGKQFKRRDKLIEHIKKIHSEERERNMEKQVTKIVKKRRRKVSTNTVECLIKKNTVNYYFYKCRICKIGFKRRGMLVNHVYSLHPDISLDTIPELNVPILKACCSFLCLYCDRVYLSNFKRKIHILKQHPGAELPNNLERGNVMSDPYSTHVKDITLHPFKCEFCYKQYASRAKLLGHHRRQHADQAPVNSKNPPKRSAPTRRKKGEIKKNENDVQFNSNQQTETALLNGNNDVQLQSTEFQSVAKCNIDAQHLNPLQNTLKNSSQNDVTQSSLTDVLRNPITQEQYILNEENSSTLIQQFLTTYSFQHE